MIKMLNSVKFIQIHSKGEVKKKIGLTEGDCQVRIRKLNSK